MRKLLVASTLPDLFWDRPAPTPARNTNRGAQKWVIQRVRKKGTVVLSRSVGFKPRGWKKSRV
jgi:hypothetical protein